MAASTHSSRDFVASFEHGFASLMVVFIFPMYCLQKKS